MKCICKRKPNVFIDEEGFFVACSRCGRETARVSTYEEALKAWEVIIIGDLDEQFKDN